MFSTGPATANRTPPGPINSVLKSSFNRPRIFWQLTQANPLTSAIHLHIVVERLASTESGGAIRGKSGFSARDLLGNQGKAQAARVLRPSGAFLRPQSCEMPNKTLKSLATKRSGVAVWRRWFGRFLESRSPVMTNRSTTTRAVQANPAYRRLACAWAGNPPLRTPGPEANEPVLTG